MAMKTEAAIMGFFGGNENMILWIAGAIILAIMVKMSMAMMSPRKRSKRRYRREMARVHKQTMKNAKYRRITEDY